MPRSLLVGIIGLRVNRRVAKKSAIPEVQMLTGLKIAAAASNSPAPAEASTRAVDAAVYGDGADLSLKVA